MGNELDGGLLSRLLKRGRPAKTVTLPGALGRPDVDGGPPVECVLYALGFDEISDAWMDARSWLAAKYKIDPRDVEAMAGDLFDLEKQTQVVFRACRDPVSPTTLGLGRYIVDVRRMAPDDIRWLHDRAIEWSNENSEYTQLKLDELGKMVLEDLGKAGVPEIFWQRCDSVSLRFMCRLLASEVTRLTRELSTATLAPKLSSPPSTDSLERAT